MLNIYNVTLSTFGDLVGPAASLPAALSAIQENGRLGHIYEVRADDKATEKMRGLSMGKFRVVGEPVHTMTRDQAADGLSIRRYSGKWKKAQVMAKDRRNLRDRKGLSYWERVRVLFLELGGTFSTRRESLLSA